jgi:colanic acid/amylovoran biosynthesis glycosyltransferase
MKRIAYLLHAFPRITDTFIMREIRALRKAGTHIQIISVRKPDTADTDAEVIEEWLHETRFLLSQSKLSIARILLMTPFRSPIRFAASVRLALTTSRPGLRGLMYQMFYFAEAMLAADVLRKSEIAHVHNHFGDHGGIIAMLAAKLANIDYSISFHGPHVFFDGTLARIGEKVAHARFARCISYFCRSQVLLFSGSADVSSLKIVHCGLELSSYQFRLPKEKIERIYCAARLAPEKGFEFLFQAMKILQDKNYDLELRLVGDGPSRGALERLGRELGILDRLHFLGYVDEATKMRELYASDLFVLPSLAEGLPSSATEAMAVGVPVIATNIAGTSELIEHGKNGLLVRPSDPQALADAIIRMIEDYDFRMRAAELGRKKVLDEFDVDKEAVSLRKYLLEEQLVGR